MIKKTTLILLLFSFAILSAQENDQYLVSSKTLNVRNGAGKEFKIVTKLNQNEAVSVLEKNDNGWWKIEFDGDEGYVFSDLLTINPDSGWDKKKYDSGQTPDCENINPQFDYKIDNSLRVIVGSNTDVVIKLMKKQYNDNDICSRIIFIRSGDTYYLRNVPEGIYYLKIAYGKDWRQKIVDNQCYGKFMRNAQYEISSNILDFNIIHKPNGHTSVPYFELSLDMVVSKYEKNRKSTFSSKNINETQFNK
jgi:uncharacterized protein YgiM (DUF1202 family)